MTTGDAAGKGDPIRPPEFDFSSGESRPLLEGDCHENIDYASVDFSGQDLRDHSFETCAFTSCRFREMELSRASFCSCAFKDCEIVLATLNQTRLNGAFFDSCKIVGLNFADCSDFGLSLAFKDCVVGSSVLFGKSLRKMKLLDCRLLDCDFGDCDLREADFSGSIFKNVVFHNCNLEKADFRTAQGYAIDPLANKIRGARFALPEAQSFLAFLGIRID